MMLIDEKDAGRYHKALHAMQSGVAMEMETNPKATEPKHLRVGINSAHVSHSALVHLLIEKGLINAEEMLKHDADEMEREVKRYEANLSEQFGSQVTLG